VTLYIKKEKDFFLGKVSPLKKIQIKEQQSKIERAPGDSFYWWIHLSCAFWLDEITLPARAPVKLNRIEAKKTNKCCIVCE